jgi:alginate O-acetyltransferase complex protein AlgI
MTLTSEYYFLFLVSFILVRKFLPTGKYQTVLIGIASIAFYSFGDLIGATLLILTSLLYYVYAERYLSSCIVLSVLTLGLFKYLHQQQSYMIPIGLSFFTFQAISYSVDLKQGKIQKTQNYFDFLAYLSFFPQLIAGPICRYSQLMPQLLYKSEESSTDKAWGLILIVQGLFKKCVLSSAIAFRLNPLFENPKIIQAGSEGVILWWLLIALYGFQLFFDFSGYTDIARGSAKFLGINIPINFRYPIFATSLKDFWSRWHITLSTWFRDYVYIPLGGKYSIMSLFVAFILSGLWHGFYWNFLLWGLFHAILLFAERLIPFRPPVILGWLITYFAVTLGWVFFRFEDFNNILIIVTELFNFNSIDRFNFYPVRDIIILFFFSFSYEALNRTIMQNEKNSPSLLLIIITAISLPMILILSTTTQEFIYYRF